MTRKKGKASGKSAAEVQAWAARWESGNKTVRTFIRFGGIVLVAYFLAPFAGKQTDFMGLVDVNIGGEQKVSVSPTALFLLYAIIILLAIIVIVLLFLVFGRDVMARIGAALVEFRQKDADEQTRTEAAQESA